MVVRASKPRVIRIIRESRKFRSLLKYELTGREYWHPTSRDQCSSVERPCPFVACKWNLYLDIKPNGNLILNFPHIHPSEMNPECSCALDVADRGGLKNESVGVALNITKQRV